MTFPKVKIVADSVNAINKRITTFELELHRFVWAEALTHKMPSRNAASSRAIPVATVLKQVIDDPVLPLHYGKNQSGMQAKEENEEYIEIPSFLRIAFETFLDDVGRIYSTYFINENKIEAQRETYWKFCAWLAGNTSKAMANAGYHKQIVNRMTEPFQKIKVLMTATEWNNCWALRDHPDAQPEIKAVFAEMHRQYNLCATDSSAAPFYLKSREWHLPYITPTFVGTPSRIQYQDSEGNILSTEEAIQLSSSLCAQISYRKSDESLKKAQDIYDKLINSKPVHASPCEHQGLCYSTEDIEVFNPNTWPDGITHVDKDGKLWSGNFEGWIQHRQLIPDNYVKG